MSVHPTPRHLGGHSARVSTCELPRNVAEVDQKVAVTSITDSDAAAGAAGGTP